MREVTDIRDIIFEDIMSRRVTAVIRVEQDGILACMERLKEKALKLGLEILEIMPSGTEVKKNDVIVVLRGNPKQVALAEDHLIGIIAKTSGVATAARRAVELSRGKIRVVCGAWKKMPIEVKELLREAIRTGGVGIRITDEPFVYIDKNYVRMFGGIAKALEAARKFENRVKVVQIRGETMSLEEETVEAVVHGADIIMVDTGNLADVEKVDRKLRELNVRSKIKLAFGGNIKIRNIPEIIEKNVDIIDVGKEIIDAPLLDMKLDVVNVK